VLFNAGSIPRAHPCRLGVSPALVGRIVAWCGVGVVLARRVEEPDLVKLGIKPHFLIVDGISCLVRPGHNLHAWDQRSPWWNIACGRARAESRLGCAVCTVLWCPREVHFLVRSLALMFCLSSWPCRVA